MQNEHVGWGSVVEAADAANGSWAETKQSDADPQCGARAFFVCANADGGVSERREDYYEPLWMDGRAALLPKRIAKKVRVAAPRVL